MSTEASIEMSPIKDATGESNEDGKDVLTANEDETG